jgi:ankyrin repeat protein
MKTPRETLLLGFETHSTETIQAALNAGADVNGLIGGRTPFTWLLEMYMRSPKFSDCVRCLIQAGAQCPDAGLLAVLLDDEKMIEAQLRADPSLLQRTVNIRSAFTPLYGAALLHVAAEYGLARAAAVLLKAGANPEAKAAVDDDGFNGHTPIFHTVCQRVNHSQPVLRLLLAHGAKPDVRVAGITWGKTFEWATTIFDATPMSYAQAGLLPQFGRAERDVYENITLLAQASGRALPKELNVPNRYLQPSRKG